MIKREKLSQTTLNASAFKSDSLLPGGGGGGGSGSSGAPSSSLASASLGTNLLMKNFDSIISRFKEKDPIFHSVSRSKLDSMYQSHKVTPPPGTYDPKVPDTFKVLLFKGNKLTSTRAL